jgi:lysophospholipase L1-like esterase
MSIVINAGVGGNNTRALLARVDTDVLSHRPSTVIMMVGTNDALNSGALVPLDEYRENLDVLVTRMVNDGIRVLLATIAPFHVPALMTRHRIDSYGDIPPTQRHLAINNIIRDTAEARSVPLAEVNTVLSVLGNIGEEQTCVLRNIANSGVADGVHPTAAGYAMIAAIMFQTIRDYQLPTDKIVCFGDSITFGTSMPGQGTANGTTYPARLAELLRIAPADRLDGDVTTNP